jgi:hypothetical protein
MITRRWIIAGFLLLLAAPAVHAGSIKGRIQNGTQGYGIPDSLVVILHRYRNNQEDTAFQLRTVAAKDGRFSFTNLEENPAYVYQPMTRYGGVEYWGTPVHFTQQEKTKETILTIYEPTDSDSTLSVMIHHIFIQPAEGFLRIQEVLVLENSGDRSYVGQPAGEQKFRTVSYQLPPEASDLRIESGLMSCCILPEEGGFYDTMPVLPGKKEIVFSYFVDTPDKEYTLIKPITLKTTTLDILVGDPNLTVAGDRIVEMPVEQARFRRFVATHYQPGEVLKLQITGLSGKPLDVSTLLMVSFGLILLAVLAIVSLKLRNRKSEPEERAQLARTAPSGEPEPDLITKLAELDIAFEANKLDEEQYRRQREELMNRLKFQSEQQNM